MRNHILIAAAALGVLLAASPERSAAQAAGTDEAEIRALIADVYDVISGPAGQERDWARMRTLFTPDARLSAVVPRRADSTSAPVPTQVVMTLDQYIERSGPFLTRDGFFEVELFGEIEQYGNVAQVWSTYVSRIRSPDSEPIDRGINSFQLVRGVDGWRVYSILWNSERSGAGPIPERYLD